MTAVFTQVSRNRSSAVTVANCGRFRTCNSYCKYARMIINLQENVLLWHHHNYSLSNYHQFETSIMMLMMKASCLLYI